MEFKKLELGITGMTCDHCAKTIKKLLSENSGLENIIVSYPLGTLEASINTDKTSEKEVIQLINSTDHYRVVQPKGKKDFDLIIIGGGSAAFSVAIKAESLGLPTLMVNDGLDFGGTCVNVGCVPSKTLIRTAETVYHATHSNFSGVIPQGAEIDFARVIQDKKQLVVELQQKKYMDVVKDFEHLTLLKGWARFVDDHTIVVDEEKQYTASKLIIATGARTNVPDVEGLDTIGYLTNVSLFNLEEKPESITIMGAGYIGLEMAMAYNRLGVKVRIIEFTDRVLRTQTPDISEEIEKHMRNEGIEILPNYRAFKFEKEGKNTIIHCKSPDGSLIKLTEKGKVVIATGTTPNTQKLGLTDIGIKLTSKGHVVVNEKMETSIPHIYAAGDVANTPSYVYTAAYEGKIAVENAFTGSEKKADYSSLGWVVFTDPQIAGTGLDETQAGQQGFPFEVSKIPLSVIPRSLAARDTRGFIKLIRHSETKKLIGARIVAPEGGELVQLLSMAINHGTTTTELAENLYPYLTLGEGIKLAAIAFDSDVNKLSCCAS